MKRNITPHAPGAAKRSPSSTTTAIATAAARLIAEGAEDWGQACHRAARDLGAPDRTPMPDAALLHESVRTHLALFCPQQCAELAALRALALHWMQRLAAFCPHITGAVWNGLATRHSAVCLHLFCDDAKALDIALINAGVRYDVRRAPDAAGMRHEWLVFGSACPALGRAVDVRLRVRSAGELRGALRRLGADGRSALGGAAQLRARIAAEDKAPPGGWGTFPSFPSL